MRALRERVRLSLTVETQKPAHSGFMIRSGSSGSLSSHSPKLKERRGIKSTSEAKFAKHYKLKGEVMASTNVGMKVLFAQRLSDNVEVVIKVRDKSNSFKRGSDEREWRCTTEIQLNMPKNDTLCEYLEVLETKDNYYVVMEKVDGRDLFEQMQHDKDGIKQVKTREIVWQILSALSKLHGSGRIHKDLKLENVMVDMNTPKRRQSQVPGGGDLSPPSAKLIDFDTVQDWEPSSPKARDVLGTDGYIAPEAYGGQYSPASDIYCVGVILYKLLTRKFPFRSEIFDDQPGENWVGSPAMARIQERLKHEKIDFQRPPLNKCPAVADLLAKMLAFDAAERPSAEEAMGHPWFYLKPEELSPRGPRLPSVRTNPGGHPLARHAAAAVR
eukprot:TRINITY_DN13394_c0_g2_i2.p1 TRINITY_DN13394_c0_g2~~TRINITY_DN13394_c0_g2_i2.p1  ORF type:complete len:385 (+),score=72.02 TRINITY_DN13394_c0_g2_i2:139-1293(+)